MSNVTVSVNGLAMETVLRELDSRLERVGQFVENTAKENCPADSGILRASISHVTDGVTGGSWYKLNSSKDGLEPTTLPTVSKHAVSIGTSVEYAIPVHEGHGSYAGKPFLKDAAYNHIAEIKNILGGR